MNKKNLPWIIGGALLVWYFYKRSKTVTPTAQPELLAVENTGSTTAATFTPDYTPEEKIIAEAFKNGC